MSEGGKSYSFKSGDGNGFSVVGREGVEVDEMKIVEWCLVIRMYMVLRFYKDFGFYWVEWVVIVGF